jgi:DNA ligase-1
MSDCDSIIRILEDHPSRLNKEGIIEAEANSNNTELFEGLRMCYDPLVTFGVKKVPSHSGPDGQGLPWVAFKELAHLLATRQLTGHDARDAIELALTTSTKSQWNDWYRRILIKDMRAGFTEGTVNRVCKKEHPQFTIPVFECMLAHDGAKHEKKITGKKLLEPKLDGVRVVTVVNADNKTAVMYSRNGTVLENFSHITQAIEANIEMFDRSIILDGEMVSSSFQALMKQVHRKSDVDSEDARLMVFDMLPLSEFQRGESTLGQRRRSNALRTMKTIFDRVGSLDIIPQKEVDLDSYVGELEFIQYNKDAIDAGFEGIMIKDVDAPYECKRSVSWLKMKPFIEVSLEITNVEEGTGKNVGRLGALVCSGVDEGRDIRVNVGSGLSDADRTEFWANRDNLSGQIVEVRADAITQNQDGTYSLRFPRFLRFRGFAAGEKI